jgi:hypothetical protein
MKIDNMNTEEHEIESISESDLKTIESQLGRLPVGVRAVASYCKYGCPQVIQNETFIKGIPFPTLFWLTCPVLVKAVSRIEGQGWSDIIRNKIRENADLKEKLLLAHDGYRQMRKESARDEAAVKEPATEEPCENLETGFNHAVFSTGIGGVRDTEGVKCLHAHYAHYLATGKNPLGEIVDKMLADYECERRCSAL